MTAIKASSKLKRKIGVKVAKSPDNLDLIVQVASDASLREVSMRLQEAGHFVERELPISGLIGVKATRSDLGKIERIRGVKFVKIGSSFQASSPTE